MLSRRKIVTINMLMEVHHETKNKQLDRLLRGIYAGFKKIDTKEINWEKINMVKNLWNLRPSSQGNTWLVQQFALHCPFSWPFSSPLNDHGWTILNNVFLYLVLSYLLCFLL
ncbi:unnamed protein product [Musa textilis]